MGTRRAVKAGRILLMLSFLATGPQLISPGAARSESGALPVAQRLVREGSFAVRLLAGLGREKAENEPAAEMMLGEMGIAPRNGWIADYPVTPDILGELRSAILKAAASGRISLGKEKASEWFERFSSDLGLPPEGGGGESGGSPSGEETVRHPGPDDIREYYESMGPPVVTYYPPPERFSHLYCTVPFPFRSRGRDFSGFHIQKEFHRTVFENNRVEFVSNTFHVFRDYRVFRIDPVARLKGMTYAGIGARGEKGFIATGIKGSERKIFNGPKPWVRHRPAP